MSLALVLATVLALSGVVMTAFQLAVASPANAELVLKDVSRRNLGGSKLYWNLAGNMAFSVVLLFSTTHLLGPWLFTAELPSLWTVIWQSVAILGVYDFLYYGLHRYPFHEWSILRKVHAVHHRALYPRAIDSLYIHPLETALGLGLILACTWAIGPIHAITFGVVFFVYSFMNIVVHCGMDLPHPLLRPFGYMARKHSRHHDSMKNGNYASLTPLPDLVFGTMQS